MKLIINLLEGFEKDDVTVTVDDEPVYSGEATTRNQIGLAKKLVVDLAKANAKVKIEVPRIDATETLDIDLSHDQHIGISIVDDFLKTDVRDHPYRFA
jgi:hypothetical protein